MCVRVPVCKCVYLLEKADLLLDETCHVEPLVPWACLE